MHTPFGTKHRRGLSIGPGSKKSKKVKKPDGKNYVRVALVEVGSCGRVREILVQASQPLP
jgi:hypothetical protein